VQGRTVCYELRSDVGNAQLDSPNNSVSSLSDHILDIVLFRDIEGDLP
jgi:hypothetical protein